MDFYNILFSIKEEDKKTGKFITTEGRVVFVGGPSSGGGMSRVTAMNFRETTESPLKGKFSGQQIVASGLRSGPSAAVWQAKGEDGEPVYVAVNMMYNGPSMRGEPEFEYAVREGKAEPGMGTFGLTSFQDIDFRGSGQPVRRFESQDVMNSFLQTRFGINDWNGEV